MKTGRGICVTYAILFINVAHFTLGIDFGFASADTANSTQRSVIEGGFPNHAIVSLNGQLYSAYTGLAITDYDAGYYYLFNQIFN